MTVEEEEILVDLVDLSGEDIVDVARNGDSLPLIKGMIEEGLFDKLIEAEDQYSTTLLHILAARNEVESAILLLENSLKTINKPNKEGNTPLHWASLTGNLDMIKLLVGKGAQIGLENGMGKSPICEVPTGRSDIIAFYESVLGPSAEVQVEEYREDALVQDQINHHLHS